MKKVNVLVTDRYDVNALNFIQSHLNAQITSKAHNQVKPEDLENIEVLLIRSRTNVDKHLLKKANALKLVVTSTSGFDHIDLQICKKMGITVMYTPSANIESAAQLTILHALALKRNFIGALDTVKALSWKDALIPAQELSSNNIGIIGLGRVGKRVAKLFQVFDCKVFAYDPYINDKEFELADVTRIGFNELLRQSDIISLHTPLTRETRQMINRRTLDLMTQNSFLINMARGSLVNEQDLFEFLDEERIAGAALDVFENEPLPQDSNLRKIKNLILTPHIGAFTQNAFNKASMDAAQKVVSFFLKGDIVDDLPPKVDWYSN